MVIYTRNSIQRAYSATTSLAFLILAVILAPSLAACGSATDDEGRQLPSDKQVIADVTPSDTEDIVSVDVVKGKSGEVYLHKSDLAWYFDRGVVVKRKAEISGAPDAVVIVGGLARYALIGDRYQYLKFLTTYNEYEGIPAPSDKELLSYVRDNLTDVFVSRDHTIVEVGSVKIRTDQSRVWHTALSLTVPIEIAYKVIKNNTTVEGREDVFDVRFYRESIDAPLKGLLATEKSRQQLGEQHYSEAEIRNMKTLREGL